MSSSINSPVPSAACIGKKPTAWGRPCNDPINDGQSVNVGLGVLPAVSDSVRSSPQSSYSDDVLPRPPNLNHNCYSKPHYKEEISKGNCSRGDNLNQGWYDYRCDQDRRNECRSNSYRDLNGGMIPYTQFPREHPRPFLIPQPIYPVSTFIGSPFPSIWSTYEGLNGFSYFSFDAFHNSVRPQIQYLCGPSFIPYQGFYGTLQSNFSFLLVNLRATLRKQIEYYFSSENLCDDFYLKERMDAQGWVPITLIAGFRKVQQLMKERQFIFDSFRLWNFMEVQVRPLADNIQFILDSLKPSYEVEVQGDKVRKRNEWEKWVSP